MFTFFIFNSQNLIINQFNMELFLSFYKNIIYGSNFNTNNAKDMNGMFSKCSSLTFLNKNDGRILKK